MAHFKALSLVILSGYLVACASTSSSAVSEKEIAPETEREEATMSAPLSAEEIAEVARLKINVAGAQNAVPSDPVPDPNPLEQSNVLPVDEPVIVAEHVLSAAVSEENVADEPVENTLMIQPQADFTVNTEEATASSEPDIVPEGHQLLFGAEEWVYLAATDQSFSAEIDPNVDLSLIRATEMSVFERNGREWVRFSLGQGSVLNLPVVVWLEKRPVVVTWAQVGEYRDRISFVLMNKGSLDADLLLGKNFLSDRVIADPGRKYLQPRH